MIRRRNQDKRGRMPGISRRRNRTPIAAHRVFAPLMGLWGAALGGLITLVLPQPLVLAGAARLGFGALGSAGRFALAGMAALVVGGALLVLARSLTRKVRSFGKRPTIAAMAMRHVRTIDPASELGSRSLDEPVAAMPFAPAGDVAGPLAEDEVDAEPGSDDLPPPRMLDLAEFAAMPGRNAVWVEAEDTGMDGHGEAFPAPADRVTATEPAPDTSAEPASPSVAIPAALRPASLSAVERLRAVPPSELSLIQMVERFAAAMHEHQAAAERRGDHVDLAGREAALAEALKALASLSTEEQGEPEGEPLRDALTRLQGLRGAA